LALHPETFFHTGYVSLPDHVCIRWGMWAGDATPWATVVLLNGRSEFMEKYEEPASLLVKRGYAVFSLDWRGQGLSTRPLVNPQKGYVGNFEEYVADLREIMIQIVGPQKQGPIIFLAHSMGGHVALRWMHDHADLWDLGVLSSPMINIGARFFPGRIVRFLARRMVKNGRSGCYALGNGDYHPDKQKFKGNKLTSDPRRYADHIRLVRENPHLAVGGVTYGWLYAAFESIDILARPGFGEEIAKPVLMVGAGSDRIVSLKVQKRFCNRMPRGRFHLIRESRHEILKESDAIQKEFWNTFDGFVAEASAQRGQPCR
jgi:lysophospholipase